MTTDCSSLLDTINGDYTSTVWAYWYLYNANMPATSINPLLYCLTTSSKMDAQTGWWGYGFVNWSGLDGTLDQDVLDLMADNAWDATGVVIHEIRSLSADEQS